MCAQSDGHENENGENAEKVCPSCGNLAFHFDKGVCRKCKKDFATIAVKARRREASEAIPQLPAHWNEGGERIISTDDGENGHALIEEFCRDFAVNEQTAIEMLEWTNGRNPHTTDGSHPKENEFIARIMSGLCNLVLYPGDKGMYARALMLRLGFEDQAGGSGVAAVARACCTKDRTVSKQTFLKCLQKVEQALNLPQFKPLPPMRGQRTEEAKAKMSKATKQGWQKGT